MTIVNWVRVIEDTKINNRCKCVWLEKIKAKLDNLKENGLSENDCIDAETHYLICPECNNFYKKIVTAKNRDKKYFMKEGV